MLFDFFKSKNEDGSFKNIRFGSFKNIRFLSESRAEDQPLFFDHHIKKEDFAKRINFISPHNIEHNMNARPGSREFFDNIARHADEAWLFAFGGRHPDVLDAEAVPIKARHTHTQDEPTPAPGCLACTIAEREARTGRPVVRMQLHVMRDVQPIELIEQPVKPRQHKKRRWMSEHYHKRIQKKWNKKVAGKTCLQPKQELVILSMSKAAFKALLDANKLKGNTNG